MRDLIARLVALVVAAAFSYWSWRAIKTGRIHSRIGIVERVDNPGLFYLNLFPTVGFAIIFTVFVVVGL
jgi:hypothetical protein